MKEKLYFRQLLAGRDFATTNSAASQMENFVYLIGDREKKECVVVDPAWDIKGILAIAKADGMKIVGALATHYHPDHVGGHIFGIDIEGAAELIALNPLPSSCPQIRARRHHACDRLIGLGYCCPRIRRCS
jgi:glyoxylase-like metal-dependent hydrolase (beta-lactamase superfamily II)